MTFWDLSMMMHKIRIAVERKNEQLQQHHRLQLDLWGNWIAFYKNFNSYKDPDVWTVDDVYPRPGQEKEKVDDQEFKEKMNSVFKSQNEKRHGG